MAETFHYRDPQAVGKALNPNHVLVVSNFVGNVTHDPQFSHLLDERAQADPRFTRGEIDLEKARQILALEALGDVVQNADNYRQQNPNDPFFNLYCHERFTRMAPIASDTSLAHILGSLAQEATASLPKKSSMAEGRAERQIHQVLERQLIPKEKLIRWEALRRGYLTHLGDVAQQQALMIEEQRVWEEKLGEVLNSSPEKRDQLKGTKKIFDRYQTWQKRVASKGFLTTATSERSMVLDESERKEVRKRLRLTDDQYQEILAAIREEDQRRLKRIKARHEGLGGSIAEALVDIHPPLRQIHPSAGSKNQPENPPEKLAQNLDDLTLGIAVLPDRLVKNVRRLAKHSFARQEGPKRRVSGYIRDAWQKTLLEPLFQAQHDRFASALTRLVRSNAFQSSLVPVEIPVDLVDQVLQGGKELRRQKKIWENIGLGFQDAVAGVAAIGQTSHQKLAEEWLINHRGDVMSQIREQSLSEQTALGERFSFLPKGADLDEANEQLISGVFEDRQYLDSYFPGRKGNLFEKSVGYFIKGALIAYAHDEMGEQELLKAVNHYFHTSILPKMPDEARRELDGPEFASNILSLAHQVKTNWDSYYGQLDKKTKKRKIDGINLRVLIGRGEWGAVRDDRKIGVLTRKLIEIMASTSYWDRSSVSIGAVEATKWAKDLGKEALIYAGSYLAGGLAAARLPPRLALRLLNKVFPFNPIGAALATSLVVGLQEGGIVVFDKETGRLRGVGGRFMDDVSQFLTEGGKGRGFIDEESLKSATGVDQKGVTEIVNQIEPLLNKKTLTHGEEIDLFFAVAEAKARLHLTDVMAKRKRFTLGVPIQFITFSESEENRQMGQLRSVIYAGADRIKKFKKNGQNSLDNAQAVIEAQLRVGSNEDDIRDNLARELRISQDEAKALLYTYYRSLGIPQEKSLEASLKRIAKLNLDRSKSVAVKAAVSSLVVGGLILAASEVGNAVGDIFHGGPSEYFAEWGQILHGKIPIEEVHGSKVTDLSPIQRAYLMARDWLHPAGVSSQPADVEGIKMFLPTGVNYDAQNNVIINSHNGQLIDLSKIKLMVESGSIKAQALVDFNGDGHIDFQDNLRAQALLEKSGINFNLGPQLTDYQKADVLAPTGVKEVTLNGQKTIVPQGVLPDGSNWQGQWIKNGDSWDLVAVSSKTGNPVSFNDGKPIILVNNAQFDSLGQLTSWDNKSNGLTVENIGAPPKVVTGQEAVNIWQKLGKKIDPRNWWRGNDLKLEDYKEVDAQGDNVLVLDASQMGKTQLGDQTVTVNTLIKQHKLSFNFSLPGYTDKPIIVPEGADGVWDGRLVLDPSDTEHTVNLSGQTISIGELTQMIVNKEELLVLQPGRLATQLRNLLQVFNLGNNGEVGNIEVGFGKNNILATIQGSSEARAVTDGGFTAKLTLEGKITEVIQKKIQSLIAKTSLPQLPAFLFPFPARRAMSESQDYPTTTIVEGRSKRGSSETAKARLLTVVRSDRRRRYG